LSIDTLSNDNDEKTVFVPFLFQLLGEAWTYKGEYDKAIGYYEKALQINLKVWGEQHP
jgi:tetratricopeptide (TPR) repeat protein